MTFESSKIMAGIGSILMATGYGSIIGFILTYIGMKDLAEHYKDNNIIDGVLIGWIFGVIGIILGFTGFIFCVTLIGAIIGIPLILVGFVFELLMAIRIRKALNALADRSGEDLARTAGTLLWYGAILSIIFVGFILVSIALIILAIAFLTLKAGPNAQTYNYTPPPPTTQSPPTGSTVNTTSNFCPNCGTPVSSGATFCANCGKQI